MAHLVPGTILTSSNASNTDDGVDADDGDDEGEDEDKDEDDKDEEINDIMTMAALRTHKRGEATHTAARWCCSKLARGSSRRQRTSESTLAVFRRRRCRAAGCSSVFTGTTRQQLTPGASSSSISRQNAGLHVRASHAFHGT